VASPELDVSSGVPLYRQIMEILRAEISEGLASPDEPMTEEKLLARFQVSRAPIRQALNELASGGFVYRKQGRGTFPVTGARVERPADLKSGNLYQYLAARGLRPASRVSGIERVVAPAPVVRRLGVAADEPVLHFTRMLAIDDQPFAANDIYIRSPQDFLPTEADLNEGGSAFALLERDYGIALDRAEHEAWATAAAAEQAEALGVAVGSPLLVIDTVFYTVGGLAAGWRSALHKPDEFKFHFVTES
jgi:GntR family transcriptional regulator